MKLLTEVLETNELYRLRILFESKGIAIHVANENSAKQFGLNYISRKYAIFIVFDEQFEDAKNLLNNEYYEVTNPMDLEHYQEHMESQEQALTNQIFNKLMNYFMLLIFLAVAGAFLKFVVLKA